MHIAHNTTLIFSASFAAAAWLRGEDVDLRNVCALIGVASRCGPRLFPVTSLDLNPSIPGTHETTGSR
jgi:hypothetical protein